MKTQHILAAMVLGLSVASPAHAAEPVLESMPAPLETRLALSALPPALRNEASVHLLDPKSGYRLARQGTSGLACLVERTQWEWGELRDDVYVPLCYDAVGTQAHLKVIMDTAALRAQGLSGGALKAEVERRYKSGTYKPPERAGLSYMVAPLMRTNSPPDMKVHTMSMPHLMFYAPGLTNEDIGAKPKLADLASLRWPFIDRQGNAEQSYMIQLVGETETAKILVDEKSLLDELCAYRELLCLHGRKH
ncbi:hypothetical protein [Piscinibacter sp. XHJ-5]|uniref:hypothetical protein n=1 Tax=Piscinibacter sp. XHJ-5 TaxID=3037797 RepID=UPI002452B1C7|nr:hypothetical protein [Piscinibacter sp. XHJ-5]